ncbi:MAG TPA: hypothetical protein VIL74_16760 [Pyrinomonadaceae bacterium]|jgi:hypothetical protein
MKISPELSEKIQKTIDEFVGDPEPFLVGSYENLEVKLNLRKVAAEINVLPLAFDLCAAWGLQADKTVIFFTFDKPYKIDVSENQKIINMVFFDAAKNYPELEELKPVRNPESIVCPGCDGTGIYKEFANHEILSKFVRCNCGGVGWLPGDDPTYLYF